MAQTETPINCGTDDYTQRLMQTDSAYRNFVRNAKAIQNTDKAANDAILTIPVVFVVYHLGEPVGQGSNVSEADLQGQIDLMNRQFAAKTSAADGFTSDSRIRFVLAKRRFDCQSFNGIFRIDGRSVPGYQAAGVDYDDGDLQQKMVNLAGNDINQMGQQAVIVRVFWQISGAGGWASYGGSISVGAERMKSAPSDNILIAHEMGHVLFLYHTFQGGDDNINCPANANPLQDGDQVADTDPHLKGFPTKSCDPLSEANINACTARPFGKIGRNFMSYGCYQYIFTPGQIARMRSYLAGSLSRFVNSPYAVPISGNESATVACVPTSASPSANTYHQEGIARFQLGTINLSSYFGGYTPVLYQDLSCLQQARLHAGQSYTLTIEAPYNTTHRRVYLDWNNDGQFDESTERLFSTTIGDETATLPIPTNAVTGQMLRLRVLVCDGNTPPTACFLPTQGAVQDFGIRLDPPNTPVQLALGQLENLSYCAGQSLFVPYTLTGSTDLNALPVTLQLSDAAGSFASPTTLAEGTGGTLTADLPAVLASGSGYLLRLVATGANLVSNVSPSLLIKAQPTATLTGPTTMVQGQSASLTLSLGGGGPWIYSVREILRGSSFGTQTVGVAGQESLTTTLSAYVTSDHVFLVKDLTNGCISTNSVTLTITTACLPPANLIFSPSSTTAVYLNWEYLVGKTYFVEWRPATASTWTSFSTTSTNSLLTNLVNGQAYEWRVGISCPDSQTLVYSPTQSFTLNCYTPNYLTESITPNQATLYWSGSYSNPYTLEWRVAENATWNTITGLANGIYTLSGLTAGTAYEWRVRSLCGGNGSTPYSNVRRFTTGCGVPQYPNSSSIRETSAQIAWYSVSGTQYVVRWRLKNTTTWTTSPTLTVNSYLISGLSPDQSYEWQVGAICSGGQTSDFTEIRTFGTSCPVSPLPTVTNLSSVSAQINWTAQSGKGYLVQWRRAGTTSFSSTLLSSPAPSSFALTGLANNTAYELQLQQYCASNQYGASSGIVNFMTLDCPMPVLVTQLSGSQTALSGGAITVPISVSGQAPWSITLSTGDVFSNISTSPYMALLTLNNPYIYLQTRPIWVTGVSNTCGSQPYYSNSTLSVQVAAPCVVPSSLSANLLGTSSTSFNWLYPAGAYMNTTFQIRPTGTNSWSSVSNVYSPYYRNNLTYGQAYEWRVQPICAAGYTPIYTDIQSFTMGCPTPTSLNETFSPTEALLQWVWNGSGAAAVNYTLQWRPTGASNWTSVNNINITSYRLTGLTNAKGYEWQLRTNCPNSVTSVYAPVRSFTTGCGMPYSLFASSVQPTSTTINWAKLEGVQSVVSRWRLSTPTSWTTGTTAYTGTNGVVSGLMPNTNYQIAVQSVCADGSRSPFTEPYYVYTSCTSATASLTGSQTVTTGQTATLTATLTGSSPWSLTLSNGQSFSGVVASPFAFTVAPASTTTYTLARVANACGTGIVSGSVVVTVQNSNTCQTPTNPTESSLQATSVRLNWGWYLGTSLRLQWRPVGAGTWNTVSGIISGFYNLTGLTASTAYEWQVQTDCSPTVSSALTAPRTFTTLPPCTLMYTLQNGSWADPAVWSCNRLPTTTDLVELRHTITIPGSITVAARQVRYTTGGKLIYGTSSKLLLGF